MPSVCDRITNSATVATSGPSSTPTSMAPSPSHLATRTPRRGRDVANEAAKAGEQSDGRVVAVLVAVLGEARDVDEGKGARDGNGLARLLTRYRSFHSRAGGGGGNSVLVHAVLLISTVHGTHERL